jgi:mannitol-specific phosphotransferase system IIBC component
MSAAAPDVGIGHVERTRRSWRAATFLAVVAAVASLAVAIVALNRSGSARTSDIAQLSSEVRSLKAELTVARTDATTAFTKDGAAMAKITTCLPEVSGEINGLTVETGSQGGFLTSAYLQPHSQVSSY